MFRNGLGAMGGRALAGIVMSSIGAGRYWLLMAVFLWLTAAYGLWRMTRRPSAYAGDKDYEAVSYPNILPGASPVAVETAQELYVEATEASEAENRNETTTS